MRSRCNRLGGASAIVGLAAYATRSGRRSFQSDIGIRSVILVKALLTTKLSRREVFAPEGHRAPFTCSAARKSHFPADVITIMSPPSTILRLIISNRSALGSRLEVGAFGTAVRATAFEGPIDPAR